MYVRLQLMATLVPTDCHLSVDFDDAWQNRLNIELDEIKRNAIARDDLITNKRACERPKDIADAVALDPTES